MAKKNRTIYDVDKDIAKKHYECRLLEIERTQLEFIQDAAVKLLENQKTERVSAIWFRIDNEIEED